MPYSKKRKIKEKPPILLKIERTIYYTNLKKVDALVNKFKYLAKRENVEINLKFIKR